MVMKKNKFEFDRPVSNTKDDKLGYVNFANKVAESLYNNKSENGLVVSINAPWGCGKSSCINFIKENLQKYKDVEILDFNPWWYSSNSEELIANFFLSLKPFIQNLYKLKKITAEEKEGILNILSGFTLNVGFVQYDCNSLAKAFSSEFNIVDEKNKIEKFLKKYKKKLFVFIDDIDRLNINEITQIFRLVKSVGNFNNITYILAFDSDMVSDILKEEQLIDGNKYLEKIIQIPLRLPEPSKGSLQNLFYEKIDSLDVDYSLSDGDTDQWFWTYNNVIKNYINNPRDINRYCNGISATYPTIKNDVNFIDFIILEFIRIFLPKLWELIANNQDFFIGKDYKYKNSSKLFEDDLDKMLSSLSYKKDDCFKLIQYLFPNLHKYIKAYSGFGGCTHYSKETQIEWEKNKKICSEDRIAYYFSYTVGSDDISDSEVEDILRKTKNIKNLDDIFKSYHSIKISTGKSKLSSLLEKLWYFPEEIKKAGIIDIFVTWIFMNISDYEDDDTTHEFISNDNKRRLERLLYRLYKCNSQKENYDILKKIINSPYCILQSAEELIDIALSYGRFEGKINEEAQTISEDNLDELLNVFINTVKLNIKEAISCKRVLVIMNLMKEIDSELYNKLIDNITKTDDNFIHYISSFYTKSVSQTIGSYNYKVKKYISVKGIERHFNIKEVKKRLFKISKNKDKKDIATNLLYDINNPPERD